MAERRQVPTTMPAQEVSTPSMSLTQEHSIHVGDMIQLNGTLYNVPSLYEWKMMKPDGEEGYMTNPIMPGPSFVAEEVGDYVVTLQTADGEAVITVHVSK